MRFKWELILGAHKNDICRLKVFGGWIVRSLTYERGIGEDAKGTCESMVFVPDKNHEWKIDDDIEKE